MTLSEKPKFHIPSMQSNYFVYTIMPFTRFYKCIVVVFLHVPFFPALSDFSPSENGTVCMFLGLIHSIEHHILETGALETN